MRFVGAFTDILIGSVIDRTNTRMGKFRPHIMVFCVPLLLSAVFAFSPAGLRGTNGVLIWAVVTCFLLGSVFYTLVNIPYGSLAAAMTGNSQDRSKFALARTIGTGIMQIVTAVAISPAIQQFAGDPDGLQATLTRTIALLVITSRANVERRIAEVGLKESLQTLAANRALQTLAGISVVYLAGLFCVTGILIYYARDALAFVGEALGDWAGLWLIGQFGCVSGAAAQPDPAITGITLAAGVAPAAFFLLAADPGAVLPADRSAPRGDPVGPAHPQGHRHPADGSSPGDGGRTRCRRRLARRCPVVRRRSRRTPVRRGLLERPGRSGARCALSGPVAGNRGKSR